MALVNVYSMVYFFTFQAAGVLTLGYITAIRIKLIYCCECNHIGAYINHFHAKKRNVMMIRCDDQGMTPPIFYLVVSTASVFIIVKI